MKRHFKIIALALCLMAGTALTTSCEKDDPKPEQQEPQDTPELVGTSWACLMENDYTMDGISGHITCNSALDFKDETNVEMFLDMTVTFTSVSYPPQSQDFTSALTYRWKDGKLILHEEGTDDESGEPYSFDYICDYDATAQTITMDWDDEDMAQMLGTDVMVFNRTR